jgi:hypothetical protein
MATAYQEASMLRRDRFAVLAWIAVGAWLLATAGGFWFFQMSDWRPFNSDVQAFPQNNREALEQWYRRNLSGGAAKLTLVDVYRDGCRCNRFTEPHLKKLMARYAGSGVRFVATALPAPRASSASGPLGLPLLAGAAAIPAAAAITVGPAALIFDAAGRLIYYGPFSDAAWCGSAGALVDPAIDRALAGLGPTSTPSATRGCFC